MFWKGRDEMRPVTPVLDQVAEDVLALRALPANLLPALAEEVRSEMIDAVSQTGGHLGAGLGVVELTIALHRVFNTPQDRLVWDVGHQAYPHKILTGRRSRIRTLRQEGGLSGFTKRDESPFDPFGAGHSSTSISAGLGMAVAQELLGQDVRTIAVIGDGALSGGMAWEALNNAGFLRKRLIIILNDNDMSISPPVGAVSAYLARLLSSRSYRRLRAKAKDVTGLLSGTLQKVARRAEEHARGLMTGGTLFEELGLYYVGPINGHDFSQLIPVLENLRDSPAEGPVLVHVVTEKGRGYAPAESSPDRLHAVTAFDKVTGKPASSLKPQKPCFTQVFSETLVDCASRDGKIVAITAAMPSGTGLGMFAERFPSRFFDVGIAEQHAVTFAAGLAAEGLKPFVALYSTFLQRAVDQVMHDVALQNLPVRFAIDRAGLVGGDGATHAGAYDTAMLGCLPGMVLMAAADAAELQAMVVTAAAHDAGPIAFRYPRGAGGDACLSDSPAVLPLGRGRVVREGEDVAILSYGARLSEALKAAETLARHGMSATVADARFARPLDEDLLLNLVRNHRALLTVEEGSVGGFSSLVLQALSGHGALDDGRCRVRCLTLPDRYVAQDASMENQYHACGLDASAMVEAIRKMMR